MIIKSKSYKTECYQNVIAYVLRESELENGFVISRFIKGNNRDVEAISKQYKTNESYRKHIRKNNVKLYMDILSFKAEDARLLTNDKLEKIAKKYISLRSPLGMSLCTVHRNEKSHTHLHFVFSGTHYRIGIANRISRDDFKNKVKIPMETYQKKHFPELKASEISHQKKVSPSKKKQ
ncbi:hypothetical protein [uncultured Dokdonia sp.]|uniref:relaxase/mobilization nuclease domain-containing protein n=1 Tax=uncultured Dokdonia sp. TaxID=575653 RepID=UPI002616C064|nr:hypothetical protein [uncultured Dokdonia sp.]